MMRNVIGALALVGLNALPATAETPMSGAAFEAYVTNKTITWDYGAGILGMEQYLPGRQVRWAFEDDQCMTGHWFEDGTNICFQYEDGGGPQCWRFSLDGQALRAQFVNVEGGTVINEIDSSAKPLACSGPDVGV